MVEKIYVHVMMVECYVMKRVLGIKIGCREISIPKENIEFFNYIVSLWIWPQLAWWKMIGQLTQKIPWLFHRFRHHKCMPWARKELTKESGCSETDNSARISCVWVSETTSGITTNTQTMNKYLQIIFPGAAPRDLQSIVAPSIRIYYV